jgi:hypothetical protein
MHVTNSFEIQWSVLLKRVFIILNKAYILIHVDSIISVSFLFNGLAGLSFLNYFTRGLGIIRVRGIFSEELQ